MLQAQIGLISTHYWGGCNPCIFKSLYHTPLTPTWLHIYSWKINFLFRDGKIGERRKNGRKTGMGETHEFWERGFSPWLKRRENKGHAQIFFPKIKGRLPLCHERRGCHFVFKRKRSWFLKIHDAQARSERAHIANRSSKDFEDDT